MLNSIICESILLVSFLAAESLFAMGTFQKKTQVEQNQNERPKLYFAQEAK